MSDNDLAADLARKAGALLLDLRRKDSGPTIGIEGDRRANRLILDGLAAARPDDAVLSEESPDDRTRLTHRRVWIVDPLDGTREYAEGRDDWAVHIALAVDGCPLAGVVAVPAQGRLYRADDPPRALTPGRPLRLAVSRSRRPPEAEIAAAALGAELVPIGSAGVKAMAVVAGEVDAYLHTGGQREWDNCAPVAVALGAGLWASRLDGSRLVYNQADTLVSDLLISSTALGKKIVDLFSSPSSRLRK